MRVRKRQDGEEWEGLDILKERMKALDPETSETYMFIGCEQEEEKK